jgi:hypothetical protein
MWVNDEIDLVKKNWVLNWRDDMFKFPKKYHMYEWDSLKILKMKNIQGVGLGLEVLYTLCESQSFRHQATNASVIVCVPNIADCHVHLRWLPN